MIKHKLDEEVEDILQHFGIKGMRWGVRRSAANTKGMKFGDRRNLKKMSTSKQRQKYLDEKDSKWLEKVKDNSKVQKVAARTSRDMRKVNKELKKEHGSDFKRAFDRKSQGKFQRDLKDAYDEIITGHTYSVYKLSPTRTREVELKSMSDGSLKATVVERVTPKLAKQRAAITKAADRNVAREAKQALKDSVTHSDQSGDEDDITGMFFIITMDEDGFPGDVIAPFDNLEHGMHELDDQVEDVLKHWGIQGMKWDVRRTPDEIKADAEAGVNAVGEAMDDAGDEVLGNDSVMGELGDVLDVVFGGKGNLKKETKQLVDASKDKLEDISKDVKKRGYRMLERMFGTTEQARARDKAKKQDFINGMKAGVEANRKKKALKNNR